MIKPTGMIKHLGVHLDDSLTFHAHTDDAAARGSQCLGVLSALRHNHRGLSTYTALHLIRTAFLPKILWASPVWWTGSQHILTRLEPIYHRALRWASGLPAYTAIRKLLLLTRSPPLSAILNHLSARYAIHLMFAAADHPLQEYIELVSRQISQPWLNARGPQGTGTGTGTGRKVHYPTLRRPMSLVARHLRAGEILEDTHIAGPSPTPPFPISMARLEDPAEAPQQHRDHLQKLPEGTVLLYTDGSKSDRHRCGSAWTIYHNRHLQHDDTPGPELASGYCCIGDKSEVYDAELHAIQEGLLFLASTGTEGAPGNLVVCVDNQAALMTLAGGNPNGTEYAQHTLNTIGLLQGQGWSVSGLWTPAHCGIPGKIGRAHV